MASNFNSDSFYEFKLFLKSIYKKHMVVVVVIEDSVCVCCWTNSN